MRFHGKAIVVPLEEVRDRFGYYNGEAVTAPVIISEGGEARTVLLSFAEFNRLNVCDRRVYRIDEIPDDIAAAILSADVPDELDDV